MRGASDLYREIEVVKVSATRERAERERGLRATHASRGGQRDTQ